MTANDFKKIIEFGKESTSLEFKESETWENLKQKIIRFILAMTNTREGGHLIIGITDEGKLKGMKKEHVVTYKEEEIKDCLAEHADPHVNFNMDIIKDDGKNFVVFTVREFDEIPVICKKDNRELHKGVIYIRTINRRPESASVPDSAHMRSLIELATDKMNENLKVRGLEYKNSLTTTKSFQEEIDDLNI